MLYTPHFLTGAAIANNVVNPIIGLPLALVSHVVLDLIPHSDFDLHPGITFGSMLHLPFRRQLIIFGTMAVDGLLLLSSLWWLWITHAHREYLLISGLTAISPDLMEQSLMVLGIPLTDFQEKFQWRVRMRYGFISYPIVCAIALAFL